MSNNKIQFQGTNYQLMHAADVDKIEGQKAEKITKIVGKDGCSRSYQLYTITKNINCPKLVLAIAASVITPFLALAGQFSLISQLWESVKTGHTVSRVAVDITAVTEAALKAGLIPALKKGEDTHRTLWEKQVFLPSRDFSTMLGDAIEDAISEGRLIPEIKARQTEIEEKKNTFRDKLDGEVETQAMRKRVFEIAQQGKIDGIEGGQGGAYFLRDAEGNPKFIIKPNDEDILCLNNRKENACPLFSPDWRIRADIETYQSAQNEALASDMAGLAGLRQVAPETVMVVIESDEFFLLEDRIPEEYRAEFAVFSKEKLCSAQEFIPDSEDLSALELNLNKQELIFDQQDFEMANILTWITADEDGHGGNYRVYDKDDGKKGLKKIDNGLCLGDEHGKMVNELIAYSGHISQSLSEQGRKLILEMPVDTMVKRMRFYQKSEQSIEAFKARINAMQTLVRENPEMTLSAINERIKQA